MNWKEYSKRCVDSLRKYRERCMAPFKTLGERCKRCISSVQERYKRCVEAVTTSPERLRIRGEAFRTRAFAGTWRAPHIILWLALLFVVIALMWAYWAELDTVTVAEGKVIPSQQIQIIQNLEGGIVKKINVKEGDIVEKGQELMLIDDTQFNSSFREEQTRSLYLRAKIARLRAEVNNQSFVPPPELVEVIPQQIESEKAEYLSHKSELAAMIERRNLLIQELEMNRPLVKQGAVSKVELLRIEQAINEMNGKISNFQSQTLNDLNQSKAELARIQENVLGLKDRVQRTSVRSPMRGVVKQIYVNTIGGVVKPGMDILEIVPLDDTLLVEAQVRPRDIGFLHPGQSATVKITAYDYAIYGGLEGKLEHISADTSKNEKDESYYEVLVRTNRNHLSTPDHPLEIIPGMTATVDIKTGKKTVLDYLLKPIMRARERALQER